MGKVLRHIHILNLILLAVAVGFFSHSLLPAVMSKETGLSLPKEASPKTQDSAEWSAAVPSISDYAVIAEKNLFHPDRMPAAKERKAQKTTMEMRQIPAEPKPELVLHGTMIAGGVKIAYVEDKKAAPATPGRGSRQLTLKEGDSIGGFNLRQIAEKAVVLVRGDEEMVLYLDELKERRGEATAPARPLSPTMPVQPHAMPQPPITAPAQRTSAMPAVSTPAPLPLQGAISQPSAAGGSAVRPRLPAMPTAPASPPAPVQAPKQ